MEIKKFKDTRSNFNFYGYQGQTPDTELNVYEVDRKNEVVDIYENDPSIECIQDFDDRGREDDRMMLKDLRQMTVHFLDNNILETDIIHKDDVDAYVKAKVELHFSPGVNPATMKETSKLAYIVCGEFKNQGSYWHTTPGLVIDGKTKGAQVFSSGYQIIWKNPKLPDYD